MRWEHREPLDNHRKRRRPEAQLTFERLHSLNAAIAGLPISVVRRFPFWKVKGLNGVYLAAQGARGAPLSIRVNPIVLLFMSIESIIYVVSWPVIPPEPLKALVTPPKAARAKALRASPLFSPTRTRCSCGSRR